MKYLNGLFAEIKLDLELSWSYKTSFISEIITIAILYISLLFMDAGESLGIYYGLEAQSKELLLVGYILWTFSIMAINTISSNIQTEASTGTLEQKFTSIIPMYTLILGQLISSLLVQFLEIAIILAISIFIFDVPLIINLQSIIIFFITVMGMYGIGLIFGGITLKVKKLGQIIFILQIILLFISNTISMASNSISVTKLIPLTIGNDLIRKAISNQAIPTLEYVQLFSTSLAWVIIGIITFNYFEKLSKKEGLISAY
ncbi:ABC transporter permease [Irregularibacter muris]|uniref:ABC transporter permease n=1 Tax=Irregularibacter muris TaxID=1796619 RepID=A0AAE3HH02_9FIRM|nr:ABC transporter permease [Irregularibacter muris]MCR1898894.1 ABC transporter permease [Irregularibacter muris]